MEFELYYSYLSFKKDDKIGMKKILANLPHKAITLMAFLAFFVILGIVFALTKGMEKFVFIPLVLETIVVFIIYHYSHHYQVSNSATNLKTYTQYCCNLCEFLENIMNVNQNTISDIKMRIDEQVVKKRSEVEKRSIRAEKWMQAILIPMLLVFFTAFINKDVHINEMVAVSVSWIFIFSILYVSVLGIAGLVSFYDSAPIRKMTEFSDDLQGILDIKFNDILKS